MAASVVASACSVQGRKWGRAVYTQASAARKNGPPRRAGREVTAIVWLRRTSGAGRMSGSLRLELALAGRFERSIRARGANGDAARPHGLGDLALQLDGEQAVGKV